MGQSSFLPLNLHPSPLWVIFEINFFRNLLSALLSGVLAIYFRQFVHSDAAVGFIFFIGYGAAMISNYYSGRIIEHLKKRKALMMALLIFTILFALLAFLRDSALIIFLFGLYQFILSLFIMDIGLYVKHYSNLKTLASNTGKLGSFGNIGWIFGPLLGSLIVDRYGFPTLFLASSMLSAIALAIFLSIRLSHEEIHFPHARPFAKNIKLFFRDTNLRRTYMNNAGLGFIYSIWDFLPLLMTHIGATLPVIGMTKTLMGVPQSIFEFPFGQMADRETGERKLFLIGYSLAVVGTLLLGITKDLRLFIVVFFLAAVGTAFLEMTRDSYFFRQIPEREIELISVYRTSDTLPCLVGQGLAVLTLSFLPLSWWFTIGAVLCIGFIINAYYLKEYAPAIT